MAVVSRVGAGGERRDVVVTDLQGFEESGTRVTYEEMQRLVADMELGNKDPEDPPKNLTEGGPRLSTESPRIDARELNRLPARDRYERDVMFRCLVDHLWAQIERAQFT